MALNVLSVDNLKQKTLAMDEAYASGRVWQLFSGGTRVLQANGSNPRIRSVSISDVRELELLTDRINIFEARIIKSDNLIPLVVPSADWSISFDGGITKKKMQAIRVAESGMQDFAWILYLAN